VPAGDVLTRLQDVLVAERHAEHVFTTVCMVTLEPGGARAGIRLAGHPPPLLLAGGGPAQPLAPGRPGPPLGVLGDARWPAFAQPLPAAWSLLLYTDGVMDGRIGDGRARLGEAGLAEVVSAAQAGADSQPHQLVRLIVERAEDLNEGPLADDVALVLMARHPS
jgi:serine phosphatase RsbU (regulator of sigma subunit)